MKERKSYLHNIHFYKDSKGREPVLDYLKKLAQKGDKDSRIKLNKINDYIQILSEYGTQAGEPYIKHLTGDIWELCTPPSIYEKDAKDTDKGSRTSET